MGSLSRRRGGGLGAGGVDLAAGVSGSGGSRGRLLRGRLGLGDGSGASVRDGAGGRAAVEGDGGDGDGAGGGLLGDARAGLATGVDNGDVLGTTALGVLDARTLG